MPDLPLPPDDPERLAALRALGMLDTAPEDRFDRISRVAARLFGAPVAFISLLDVHRQWFKSCIGLGFEETPIAVSFCAHALAGEPLLVPDATADPRFRDNPYVVESPYLRGYAGHPLRSPSGQVVGTLCVMDFVPRMWEPEDLAALKDLASWAESELASSDLTRVAHELQASESRLRAIMESAGEGIVVMGQRGETQFINAAAERIVGHPPRSLIGADFHAAVHHSRADGRPYPFAECGVSTTLQTGRTLSSVAEVYWRADGTPVPIELSCAPLLDDGRPNGAVLVFRDVSERRELEQMKDQFVSSVSHELRTPLTAIKGYLEGVLEEEVGPLTPDQRTDLHIVARNVDRLHSLINDLLLLSRMEARRADFGSAPVDLHVLLTDLVDDLRPAAAKRGQRFSVDLPAEMVIHGDEHRLRQAFANLLSNALKFGGPDGRIRVHGSVEAESLVIAVSDDGVGIPPADLERLSQRFFRASTAGTTEGTGLGLAITREIVERHHGRLEIESTVGEGSTFAIRLPREG